MFKRVLIAASVAAVFAAPAFGEATIYGSVRTGIEYANVSGPGAVNKFRLADQSSRIGFKGTDKLDNGMKVFWKNEERIRVGTPNTQVWGDRDSIIGLETSVGTFTAGKQLDAYADWTMAVIDNALFNSEDSNLYQWYFTGRKNNAIKYVSPAYAGFTLGLSYGFGNKTTAVNPHEIAGLLTYSGSMFSGNVGMIQQNDTASPLGVVSTNKAYVAAGSVKLTDAWSVGASYELAKSDDRDWKRDHYSVGVAYAAGKWGANAWYMKGRDSKVAGTKQNDGMDQINLNAHYALSKATTAGVAYTYMKHGDGGKSGSEAFGTVTGMGGLGQTVNALSVNLRTDF